MIQSKSNVGVQTQLLKSHWCWNVTDTHTLMHWGIPKGITRRKSLQRKVILKTAKTRKEKKDTCVCVCVRVCEERWTTDKNIQTERERDMEREGQSMSLYPDSLCDILLSGRTVHVSGCAFVCVWQSNIHYHSWFITRTHWHTPLRIYIHTYSRDTLCSKCQQG